MAQAQVPSGRARAASASSSICCSIARSPAGCRTRAPSRRSSSCSCRRPRSRTRLRGHAVHRRDRLPSRRASRASPSRCTRRCRRRSPRPGRGCSPRRPSPGAQLEVDRLARTCADELLLAAHHELDCSGAPPARAMTPVMKSCGSMSILPPKLPPDRRLDHRDLAPVEPEAVPPSSLRYMKDHVHRCPDGEVAVRVERGDDDVGLDRGGAPPCGAEYMPSTITAASAAAASTSPWSKSQRIATLPSTFSRSSWIAGDPAVERLEGVVDGRQRLVLDPDQVERPARRVLVDRGDRGDLVADEPDLPRLERDVVVVVAVGSLLHVPRMDHRVDARERLRLRGVEREDSRVRMRAAEDRAHPAGRTSAGRPRTPSGPRPSAARRASVIAGRRPAAPPRERRAASLLRRSPPPSVSCHGSTLV